MGIGCTSKFSDSLLLFCCFVPPALSKERRERYIFKKKKEKNTSIDVNTLITHVFHNKLDIRVGIDLLSH